MKNIRGFMKRHWKLASVCVSFALLGSLLGISVNPANSIKTNNVTIGQGHSEFIVTIGSAVEAAGISADFICSGVNDNVQWQLALNALPASGGEIEDLTGGAYNFTGTVTRAIPNVMICGTGMSTTFSGNSPDFTVGGNGWTFSNISVNSGGISVGAYTYLFTNVQVGTTLYTERSPNSSLVDGTISATTVGATTLNATNIYSSLPYDNNTGNLPAQFIGNWVHNYPAFFTSFEAWENGIIADPDVFYYSGLYYMFYNGGGTAGIGFATSPDGTTWTKYASNPIFIPTGIAGQWDKTFRAKPSVVKNDADGLWYMFYSGDDNAELATRIGVATSTDLINWTPYVSNPVLSPAVVGWDDGRVDAPYVIKKGSTWYMYYTGEDADANYQYQVGLATSTDLLHWTKSASNPVVAVGAAGTWDFGSTAIGNVIKTSDSYVMVYDGWNTTPPARVSEAGVMRFGFAYSTDLITWTKFAGNPFFNTGGSGWDSSKVYSPNLYLLGGKPVIYYNATNGTNENTGYAYLDSAVNTNAQNDESWSNASNVVLYAPLYKMPGTGAFHTTSVQDYILTPHGTNCTYSAGVGRVLNGTDDYISTNVTSFLPDAGTPFTIMMWVKMTAGYGDCQLLTRGKAFADVQGDFQIKLVNGIPKFSMYNSAGAFSPDQKAATTTLVAGTWYQVAVTFNGAVVGIWVDGIQESYATYQTDHSDNGNAHPVLIGAFNADSPSSFAKCTVGEVTIISGTVPTTAEMKRAFNNTSWRYGK